MSTLEMNGVTLMGCTQQYDLSVSSGQVAIVYGESPAIRQSLLRVLSGEDLPAKGAISIDNMNFSQMKPKQRRQIHERKFRYIAKNDLLLDYLTAVENCLIPEVNFTGITIERTKILLRKLGVNSPERRMPHELSPLERRLVAVGRSLRLNPKVLLGYEPAGGLDAQDAEALYISLQRIAREHKLIVITTEAALPPCGENQDFLLLKLHEPKMSMTTPKNDEGQATPREVMQ